MGRTAPCRPADDRRIDVGNVRGPVDARNPKRTGSACPCPVASRRRTFAGGHVLVGSASSFWTVAVPYDDTPPSWSSTCRTTSPIPTAASTCVGRTPSSTSSTARSRRRRGRRGPGGHHAGLAPADTPALRQGRRHLAGPLRGRHLGRGAPSPACGRRTDGPEGGRAARTATRASRWSTPPRARPRHRARRPAAGARRRAGRRGGPGHRLLRQGDRPRRGPAGLRHDVLVDGRRARSSSSRATGSGRSTRWPRARA